MKLHNVWDEQDDRLGGEEVARGETRPFWYVLTTAETGSWVPKASWPNLALYMFEPFVIKGLCMWIFAW